jgi:hypothetical protein
MNIVVDNIVIETKTMVIMFPTPNELSLLGLASRFNRSGMVEVRECGSAETAEDCHKRGKKRRAGCF